MLTKTYIWDDLLDFVIDFIDLIPIFDELLEGNFLMNFMGRV